MRPRYFADNISVSWQASNPPYDQRSTNMNIQYFANLAWGGPCWIDPNGGDFCVNNPQFIKAGPGVAAAPYFVSTAAGQLAPAAPTFLLRNRTAPHPAAAVDS